MTTALHPTDLRRELSERALAHAESRALPYFLSLGPSPAVVFARDGDTHGNFIDASFRAMVGEPAWAKRLGKAHTHRTSLPVEHRDGIGELDSCNSSDALLMNVMCYPAVLSTPMRTLFAISDGERLHFGYRARVPYHRGADNTELDLVAGDLIVEAKLTETSFGSRAIDKLERYRDLHEVFDVSELPVRQAPSRWPDVVDDERAGPCDGPLRDAPLIDGYQLVRNVLAAHHLGMRFRLVYDERRADLGECLYRVLRAVRDSDLRARCGAVTWQEVARASPGPLRAFLGEKYGIA